MTYTLHLVTHTHWDREWYLPFQVFRLKLVHLIDGLLDLLEHDPDFRYFTLDGQTIVLEDYLEMRPEREQDLRNHIQAGRLLVGPWYILPDEFLVSPEALVRNLLQGDRLCRRFGGKMLVGYIPDPFGHIGQMPQILRGFNIRTASLWRGLTDEPCEFWWRAPDGSQVLMAYLRDSYSNAAGLPTQDERFASEVLRLRDMLAPHAATSCLLLMHGTDHMEPPADTSTAIGRALPHLQGSLLEHSTLPRYLEAVEQEIREKNLQLPVVTGELRACKRSPLLPGVLSTRIWLKQRNQLCQTLLERWAEPFSTWANLLELPADSPAHFKTGSDQLANPAPLLRQAWRLLLQCHPHDSICGCSIDAVHDEMRPRFDQVEQIGETLTQQSLSVLVDTIDTQSGYPASTTPGEEALAVVIFNPGAGTVTARVEFEAQLPPGMKDFELVNASGQPVVYQVQGSSSMTMIDVSLSPEDFRGGMNMIHDGRILGMVVRDFQLQRQGDAVHAEIALAETGQPNREAFELGLKKIELFLADPTINRYIIRSRSTEKVRLSFIVDGVPGPGFVTYWMRAKAGEKQPPVPVRMGGLLKALLPLLNRLSSLPAVQRLLTSRSKPAASRPPYRIENEFFFVEASSQDGTLTIHDKVNGLSYQGLNRFEDGGDCGDEYNYAPPAQDHLVTKSSVRSIQVERNPVQETISITLEMDLPESLTPDRKGRSLKMVKTSINTRISLSPGVPRIEVHTYLQNQAQDHRLRVHFPAPFSVNSANFDGHFEIVNRPLALPKYDETWVEMPRPEAPQRCFTDVSDQQRGLLIANRGLPEVEVMQTHEGQTELAMTLLRCVGWLSRDDFSTRRGPAGPALPAPGGQVPGSQAFDYAIIPHPAGQGTLAAYHQAYAFNAPLRARTTSIHTGRLPASACLVEIQPAEFILSAIKTAEDDRGWIVRGYSISDQVIQVRLKPGLPYKQASLVNLAEQALQQISPLPDGSLEFQVNPHQVISVYFSKLS